MKITATDAQVEQMAKLAVLASVPMGMGFLRHDPDLAIGDISLDMNDRGLYIDYYRGRMVKFGGRKREGGWEFNDTISLDYQSWGRKYPSYQALFDAASASPQSASAVDPVDGVVTK